MSAKEDENLTKKNPRALQAAHVLRTLADQVEQEIVKSAKVTLDLEYGTTVESYYEIGGVSSSVMYPSESAEDDS